MYYPCSENKGADQLRGHREADLRLCFRIGKNPVFLRLTEIISFFREKNHLWTWQSSWSCDPDHLFKLSFHLPDEVPHKIWFSFIKWFLRKLSFCFNM